MLLETPESPLNDIPRNICSQINTPFRYDVFITDFLQKMILSSPWLLMFNVLSML